MEQIFGCDVTSQQMDDWVENFLPPEDPYYFRDEKLRRKLLSFGIIVYTRSEFGDSFPGFALTYGSNYHIWSIPRDVYVCSLSPESFQSLPQNMQTSLLRDQCDLGRGQVYDPQWMEDVLSESQLLAEETTHVRALLRQAAVDVRAEGRVVLTKRLWDGFPVRFQHRWVRKWVHQMSEEECRDFVPLSQVQNRISEDSIIRDFVNTFPTGGGANCFAAALAPVLPRPQGNSVIKQWLHEGPFERVLCAQGYQVSGSFTDQDSLRAVLQPGDVVTWMNADKIAIHAAYHIGDGTFFNKMGQCWHQPWGLLPLHTVSNAYGSPDGCVVVHRKSE